MQNYDLKIKNTQLKNKQFTIKKNSNEQTRPQGCSQKKRKIRKNCEFFLTVNIILLN